MECHPVNEYGKAKLAFFEQAKQLCRELQLTYYHLRFFSVYGKGDHPWSIISTLTRELPEGKTVSLSACRHRWNFMDIEDASRAVVELYRYSDSHRGECHAVNVASEDTRVLRDFAPHCTPEQRALIRRRADAYAALAQAETPDYNRLYEADRLLHETWFASMGKMYLFRTLQNAHADYSRFRMLDTITSGGLAEVIADHQNLIDAIERCDLAAFEPLVERHLYGGIRRLGSRLTEEYADYFEPEK